MDKKIDYFCLTGIGEYILKLLTQIATFFQAAIKNPGKLTSPMNSGDISGETAHQTRILRTNYPLLVTGCMKRITKEINEDLSTTD